MFVIYKADPGTPGCTTECGINPNITNILLTVKTFKGLQHAPPWLDILTHYTTRNTKYWPNLRQNEPPYIVREMIVRVA
jgi:hypothetical protein